jgi:hypothetical protein
MSRIGWLAVFLAAAACATETGVDRASELDISEVLIRAAAQQESPYLEEAKGSLLQAYFSAVLACSLTQGAHVIIALAIGADGRVETVYVDPSSRETRCIQRRLRRARLPVPPETPFFHAIDTTVDLLW